MKHKEVTTHTAPPVCTTMVLSNPQQFDTYSTTSEQCHAQWVGGFPVRYTRPSDTNFDI